MHSSDQPAAPAAPKGQTMPAARAVAIMSEGFLNVMKFIQQQGIPKDILAEAMRIGCKHGLTRQVNGIGPNGEVFMQYINPYADLAKDAPPAKTAVEQGEG